MKSYLLKIRGGVEVDSQGKKAGKGPLIAEEISNTLGTSQDQYLFQPVVLESHPNDSRVRIDGSGTVQTLTSRMETGGGNVPMVMMPFSKSRRAKSSTDFETWKASEVSNTINTFDQGDVRATDVVVCIQGNVIDRSDNAGANGAGWRLNQCYTLNTIDRPAVVYATGNGQVDNMQLSDKFGALNCMHDQNIVVIAMSERAMSMVTSKGVANTLAATDYKGSQVIAIDRAAFNQGENAKYGFQIDGGGTAQTLIARGPGAVCYRKPLCNGLQVGATATSDGGKTDCGKTRE